MSARNDPSILESIEEDVQQVQRQQGRRPTGLLTPEQQQEIAVKRLQRRVARESPTGSTITMIRQPGLSGEVREEVGLPEQRVITVQPATGVPEETQQIFGLDVRRRPGLTAPLVPGLTAPLVRPTFDREAAETELRRIRRSTVEETSPAAQIAGVRGEDVAEAEQEFARQEGALQTGFRAGEVTQEIGRGVKRQVKKTSPLPTGPGPVGFVGGSVEEATGIVAESPFFLGGAALQTPAAFTGLGRQLREQPTAEAQVAEQERIGGRLAETGVRAAEEQTIRFFQEEPGAAAILFGLPAAPAAARGARVAGRAARARAPGRAVEAGVRAREAGVRAREAGVSARETVFGGEESLVVADEPRAGATREIPVERATPETPTEQLIPLEQLEIGRGEAPRQIQTTTEAFEGGEAPTFTDIVSQPGVTPRLPAFQFRRAMRRRGAGEQGVGTKQQVQTTIFGTQAETVRVPRRAQGLLESQVEGIRTGEGFRPEAPLEIVGEEPIPIAEGQRGIQIEVARVRKPNILERALGRGREIEVLRSDLVREVTEPVGRGERAELQLLGGEQRGPQRVQTVDVEPIPGFRRIEQPSFEVQGGGLPAEASGLRGGLLPFEFGVERGPTPGLFETEVVGEQDITGFTPDTVAVGLQQDIQARQEARQLDVSDITGLELEAQQQEPRVQPRQIEGLDVGLEPLTGLRSDVTPLSRVVTEQRQEQRQRQRQRQRQPQRLIPPRIIRPPRVPPRTPPRVPPRTPPFLPPGVPLVGTGPTERGRQFTGFTEFQFEFDLPTVGEFTFDLGDDEDDDFTGGLTVI